MDLPFDPPVCLFCGKDPSSPDHHLTCDGRQGRVEAGDAYTLVRRGDPFTSHEAAESIAQRGRTELQRKIYETLKSRGPMVDQKLITLPEFRMYGPSTIRTRRSELHHMKLVVPVGVEISARGRKMLVWAAA